MCFWGVLAIIVAIPSMYYAPKPVFARSSPQNLTQAFIKEEARPARIIIPSIGISSPIVPMGLNSKGELDVPNGKTRNVGWHAGGPVPGSLGAAVMDAHVFAAFSELYKLEAGERVYVIMDDGRRLQFTVRYSRKFKLDDISPETLFGDRGIRELRLITCAGSLAKDHSTYTHRLVVFAEYTGTINT